MLPRHNTYGQVCPERYAITIGNIALPQASGINYTDVKEVCGYQMWLIKLYEKCGGLTFPKKTTRELKLLETEGLIWLRLAKELLTDGPLADIPQLIPAYDIMYRISHGQADLDFLKKVRTNTARRWLGGDKTLSATDIALIIADQIDIDVHSIDDRYIKYSFGEIGKWIEELEKYGQFRNIPLTEAYRRLERLMKDELFAYVGGGVRQLNAKRRWAEKYHVNNISTLDTPALLAYIGFYNKAFSCRIIPGGNFETQYRTFQNELLSRSDIHPFHRHAIELDSEDWYR